MEMKDNVKNEEIKLAEEKLADLPVIETPVRRDQRRWCPERQVVRGNRRRCIC